MQANLAYLNESKRAHEEGFCDGPWIVASWLGPSQELFYE